MVPVENKELQLPSALLLDVVCDGISKSLVVWGQQENVGQPSEVECKDMIVAMSYGTGINILPFNLRLNSFILKRYPGSESPSWFESDVQLIDQNYNINNRQRIYMNHVLRYKGYRFYQASYDSDEKGTLLSVNRDWLGTTVTYTGYILLALGMALSLLNKKSRFRLLAQRASKIGPVAAFLIFGMISSTLFAQQDPALIARKLPVIDKTQADEFAKLFVQDNAGRIEPINTLASELLRKIARKNIFEGQDPNQVMLGMLVYPEAWQLQPMIRIGHPEIQKLLGIKTRYASFDNFFSSEKQNSYILRSYVEDAYRKKPDQRGKLDNELIRADERVNVCYLIYSGMILKIFPANTDSVHKWLSPVTAPGVFRSEDSVFTNHIMQYYFEEVSKSVYSGSYKVPGEILRSLMLFQSRNGGNAIPSSIHSKAEVFYNRSDIFAHLTYIYLLIGFLLLIIQFTHIFLPRFNIRYYSLPTAAIIAIAFLFHTFGLGLRWYISGHAPWSNGYETLIFISWAAILAGLIFSRKSGITISVTAILAALLMQTAQLSWMDPQITNLTPVLNSYWLVIHVAVITSSYAFIGLAALLAVVNLLLMTFETTRNSERLEIQISLLSRIIEMILIAGLYLLTIGTFLGGVWANESWGRYWGWDPKETWALITVIVYAFILHMRLVPRLNGRLLFNIMSLLGFGSVIMTYFGVSYYLSGLHSYAKGDPLPVPSVVYYSVAIAAILCTVASINQMRRDRVGEVDRL